MRRIVITGGPGAGKTAALEVVRKHFCHHVMVAPESAGIVYGGGFPRRDDFVARCAGQRAIYYVQRELELVMESTPDAATLVCDRGTLDGLAYWPGDSRELFLQVGTTEQAELARYDAVIHLRTPTFGNGYDHSNPLRRETAAQAAAIDERLLDVWARHPRRHIVPSTVDFMDKVQQVMEALRPHVPTGCRTLECSHRHRLSA